MAVTRKKRLARAYTIYNHAEIIRGGKDYFACLLKLINDAKSSVHLHVYIFDEDDTGKSVAEALKAAAARKVEVYVLVDGYASNNLSTGFVNSLKDAGVQFRMFEPLLRTRDFYFGRRLHHKILVVDAFHSLVGGINISNKYNDVDGEPPWLDWAVYSTGEISMELLKVCVTLWTKSKVKGQKIIERQPLPPKVNEECMMRVRRNDWVQHRTQISRSYFDMFRNAQDHIIIMSSYFLPGRPFRSAMERACKRGVKMRVILAGTSDVRLSKHAERYIYQWLLRNNIEIYEFQNTVLHAKMATYDDDWATVGSYNVNNISAFASIELNLDIRDKTFCAGLNDHLEKIIEEECKQITSEDYRTRFSIFGRFIQWGSYTLVRIIFYIFTFYFRQEKSITRP
jgi:cardiolipin synthase A/B